MATINYTLQKISTDLFIKYKSKERGYIDEKIINFQKALKLYFEDDISDVLIFGSYKRDTILPRKFDEKSDIDVLVIFNQVQNKYTPETYRNQLKRFASNKYPRTTVLKDHPSIVLELSNIKFDLVPCRIYHSFFSSYYQIPDKNGDWMDTYPKEFNEKLTKVNNQYNSIVKPIIRLFKYWNPAKSPIWLFSIRNIILTKTHDSYRGIGNKLKKTNGKYK
ncbi:MAG: putative nucleotidyltransferase [Parvicella sp.]|jgi:predicted nucleotidyltransferase